MMYEKIVQGIKSKDDLVECFYRYTDSEIPINTCESFFYDLKKKKINYYVEIHVSSFFCINDSSIPLLLDDIEDDNYSLQVIQISDEWNNKPYMKNDFRKFIQNIKKFLFLREIKIELTEFNYDNIFDSEELDMLIKNLFTLQLLENIYIKINNPKIKLSKETSKLFIDMKIKEEIDCYNTKFLIVSWKYNEK